MSHTISSPTSKTRNPTMKIQPSVVISRDATATGEPRKGQRPGYQRVVGRGSVTYVAV
jgi:hypothetical protein